MKTKLRCIACGAAGIGSCDCGAGYEQAGKHADKAVAAEKQAAKKEGRLERSSRVIAKAIGVSRQTINRARKSTGTYVPVGKRTGSDGRSRRLPPSRAKVNMLGRLACDLDREKGEHLTHELHGRLAYPKKDAHSKSELALAGYDFQIEEAARYAKESNLLKPDVLPSSITPERIAQAESVADAWTKLVETLKRLRKESK